ncbi:MAG TPA: prolyl oligopeptidase family serine peptidase [Reyranella sp.]|nr:prolyl oligopeptidase family serine peptidase [Reyranella sp.]
MRLGHVLFILLLATGSARAQEHVTFASLDGNGTEQPTQIDGYLLRGKGAGPLPAVVFQHGCGGLLTGVGHQPESRQMDWAGRLNARGIHVLMVDSFTARRSGEMCSQSGFKLWLYHKRPADAYGGMAWLRTQPYVASDRIGLMGWSNGGGSALMALGRGRANGRPAASTGPDFRAAIAFYPGSCDPARLGTDWTTNVPLLILQGEKDVWTPYLPCKALADLGKALGGPVELHAYPNAYHDFDWPNLKRKELHAYTTSKGVVPITGEDPESHADAIVRVQDFLARHL